MARRRSPHYAVYHQVVEHYDTVSPEQAQTELQFIRRHQWVVLPKLPGGDTFTIWYRTQDRPGHRAKWNYMTRRSLDGVTESIMRYATMHNDGSGLSSTLATPIPMGLNYPELVKSAWSPTNPDKLLTPECVLDRIHANPRKYGLRIK